MNLFKSYETNGFYSPTMVCLFLMQLLYVADYFWLEGGILVSRDIVHEGLGYNLLIQFLMIPFCFCVQTRYISTTRYELPWYCTLAVGVLNGKLTSSIYIFLKLYGKALCDCQCLNVSANNQNIMKLTYIRCDSLS